MSVFLNEKLVLESRNMHVAHNVDVTDVMIKSPGGGEDGVNVLELKFSNAPEWGRKEMERIGYKGNGTDVHFGRLKDFFFLWFSKELLVVLFWRVLFFFPFCHTFPSYLQHPKVNIPHRRPRAALRPQGPIPLGMGLGTRGQHLRALEGHLARDVQLAHLRVPRAAAGLG